MRANNNFLPIRQASRLKELGVPQKSAFYWVLNTGTDEHQLASVFQSTAPNDVVLTENTEVFSLGTGEYSAFTAEELMDKLPKRLTIGKFETTLFVEKNDWMGHDNAYRCFYVNNRWYFRPKKGSKTEIEPRLLGTVLVEASGHTLAVALARLFCELIRRELIGIAAPRKEPDQIPEV